MTDYGTIEVSFKRREDTCEETMRFDSETQLKAFAYLLKEMVDTNAESVTIE